MLPVLIFQISSPLHTHICLHHNKTKVFPGTVFYLCAPAREIETNECIVGYGNTQRGTFKIYMAFFSFWSPNSFSLAFCLSHENVFFTVEKQIFSLEEKTKLSFTEYSQIGQDDPLVASKEWTVKSQWSHTQIKMLIHTSTNERITKFILLYSYLTV